MRCAVVGSIVCMGAATLCAAEVPAGESVVKSNADFTVTWNAGDGTLSSLVLNGDADRMNCIQTPIPVYHHAGFFQTVRCTTFL